MPEKDRPEALNEEEESDGTASDDSSEKDADSDEKVDDEESINSGDSEEEKKKKKVKKTKKDAAKVKKKGKKKKEKKDKKDKKKKKLPPVVAPDYVHCEPRSHHSRVSTVSAITIPKPLQRIAKNHTGPPPTDVDYPETELERGISTITLPKTLTIGGGDLIDDSQRSGRVSLLEDDSVRSTRISGLPDSNLLDG